MTVERTHQHCLLRTRHQQYVHRDRGARWHRRRLRQSAGSRPASGGRSSPNYGQALNSKTATATTVAASTAGTSSDNDASGTDPDRGVFQRDILDERRRSTHRPRPAPISADLHWLRRIRALSTDSRRAREIPAGWVAAPAMADVISSARCRGQPSHRRLHQDREAGRAHGVWTDVTLEILNLGIGAPEPGGLSGVHRSDSGRGHSPPAPAR